MGTTRYTWDVTTDSVMQESDGTGAVLATYTRRPDVYGPLLSQHRSGSTNYYHFDALGSTRVLSDDSQSVTDNYIYDAWGIEVATSGSTVNTQRWNSYWGYDSSPILHNVSVRARKYNPQYARFSTLDPDNDINASYEYVHNDPLNLFDPSGLHSMKDCDDDYDACIKACQRRYPGASRTARFRRALCYEKCYAIYAACLATATETLVCAATTAVVVIVIIEPTPFGEVGLATCGTILIAR